MQENRCAGISLIAGLLPNIVLLWSFCKSGCYPMHALRDCMLQIAGGHPFKPPSQDVNAPDLYIPLMALCTYCILGSIAMVYRAKWTTDFMYALVRTPACDA